MTTIPSLFSTQLFSPFLLILSGSVMKTYNVRYHNQTRVPVISTNRCLREPALGEAYSQSYLRISYPVDSGVASPNQSDKTPPAQHTPHFATTRSASGGGLRSGRLAPLRTQPASALPKTNAQPTPWHTLDQVSTPLGRLCGWLLEVSRSRKISTA